MILEEFSTFTTVAPNPPYLSDFISHVLYLLYILWSICYLNVHIKWPDDESSNEGKQQNAYKKEKWAGNVYSNVYDRDEKCFGAIHFGIILPRYRFL